MTAKVARLITNTSILTGMELGVRLLDVLLAVLLARYLGPQGFGLLAFALSFASLVSILPGFGMGSLSTRDVARDPQHRSRYLSHGLVLKVFLALLTLTVIWLLTRAVGLPTAKGGLVLLAGVVLILETNVRFLLAFFQAAQRMGMVALVNLAVNAGVLLASVAVIALKGGVGELLTARILVTGAGLIVAMVLIDRRLERITWKLEPGFIWQLTKASLPFALFRVFATLYTDIGVVMLSAMRGDVVTGWFAAAQKFRRAFTFIPTGFFGAMLPAMSHFSRHSGADLLLTLTHSFKYLALIALPIAGGLCVLAERFVLLFYGPAYLSAVPALRILAWTILFVCLRSALTAGVSAVDQERRAGAYLTVGALFNVLMNWMAIPRFGHMGAAATTLATEALVTLLQVRLLRRALPGFRPTGQLLRLCLATTLMMAFSWLSREGPLVYTVLASAAVYGGCLVFLQVIGPVEWAVVTGLFRRKVADERA